MYSNSKYLYGVKCQEICMGHRNFAIMCSEEAIYCIHENEENLLDEIILFIHPKECT